MEISGIIEALVKLLNFCLQQENCKNCPIAKQCGKMPCEW